MAAQSNNTLMRMQYLSTEIGHQLKTVDPAAGLINARDRVTVHPIGAAATAVATKAVLAPVDPSIVNAV